MPVESGTGNIMDLFIPIRGNYFSLCGGAPSLKPKGRMLKHCHLSNAEEQLEVPRIIHET
eukprot:scaffold10046_cov93-Skeletonema_dohrnii-CCMP3373.AAC.1